ncbi:MAG: 3-dehydroquinate synthase [bacterium]
MEEVRVELGRRSYSIIIDYDILGEIGRALAAAGKKRKVMVITDESVGKLYSETVLDSLRRSGFKTSLATVPAGEQTKSYKWLIYLHDRLIEHKLERSSLIVALGGGVVGDLAGFAAATYLRGVPFIQIPTTLLAQVDSSVGGKVAIDHPRGKNLIGAFYQPRGVYIDIKVLETLPAAELTNGLSEVIKYGIIRDESFFRYLEENWETIKQGDSRVWEKIIGQSCRIKAGVVSDDEFESGRRAVLNYGHTIGHAIEALSEYQGITHGQAIAAGMAYAAVLSEEMGVCGRQTRERQLALLRRNGLTDYRLDPEAVIEAISRDKKVLQNRPRFILTEKIGDVTISNGVPEALLLKVLKSGLREY